MEKQLTFGQELVGITFNPSGNEKVNRIKELCAELVDIIKDEPPADVSSDSYTYNLIQDKALLEILAAQMFAVKLVTLNVLR